MENGIIQLSQMKRDENYLCYFVTTPKGYFAFEREDGKLDSLATEELAEIVMSVADRPAKLVFLSACESAKGGDASLQKVLLNNGVPAVLGMKESIPAKATMALATPFYASLGAGMAIAKAFENALPSLKRLENGSKLQNIPTLEGAGKDANVLPARVAGKASFELEPIFGLPEHEFVGDYLRGDSPRGRKGILSQTMDALIAGEKLVVLTGQGGIGKTAIAAEAARRLAWRYPGGVFWRSAADAERFGLNELLDAFANVFGWEFRALPLDAKMDRVLSYLRNFDTASLLIVDNAETVKDTNLWRFLESIPLPSAALVTTRISLRREGKEIHILEMETSEAVRLFTIEARRRSLRWGEHLSKNDLDCLNEITSIMHGHPLAIKLIAAMVGSRSLASIRDELKRNPPKEVLDRFDISYADLTESQKMLLGSMAIFSDSVTDHAIGNVCLENGQEGTSNWKEDLGELVRRSFVDRIEIAAQDESGKDVMLHRYRLHPLMRQYAKAKAGDHVLTFLRAKATMHFLGYAQHFRKNIDMLELERENILFGMDWAVLQQKSASNQELKAASTLVLQFMIILKDLLSIRGYWNEYELRLREAICASEAFEDKKIMARLCIDLGNLASRTGRYGEASNYYDQSLEIYQKANDKRMISYVFGNLGNLAKATGDYNKAQGMYQQTLRVAQEIADKSSASKALYQLGNLAFLTGDYIEASKLCQQSLKISEELGDKSGVSNSLHQLGMLAQDTGDYGEARKFYQQSLKIKEELGDKSGVALSQAQMALLEEKIGNVTAALQLICQAEATFLELGSPYAEQARRDRERLENL